MFRKLKNLIRAYIGMLNMDQRAYRISREIEEVRERVPAKDTPVALHVALFIITVITTTLAGAQQRDTILASVLSGIPFSATIMTILLAHEMGHYFAARHFRVKATLPYFIPFPSIIGTMGAVIKIKSPIEDKRALLYIGAMGPLIGFSLSLVAAIVGMYLSEVKPLPSAAGTMDIPIFGDSLLFKAIALLVHGEIPPGHDVYLSPYAWAGWIGFLVTSLNLMPMGQLDGSHILYALIGRRQLLVGWIFFIGLAALSFIWPGWIVWVLMTLFFLMIGHPPIPDASPLSGGERLLGWCCVAIFIITFIPVPVNFL